MGLDGEVLDPGVIREHEGHDGLQTATPALLVQEVGDGAGTGGLVRARLFHGGGERGRAVVVEQIEESPELGDAGIAVSRPLIEEAVETRDGVSEAVARGEGAGGGFGGDQCGDMGGVFHDHPGVVAPDMARDLSGAIHHADEGRIRE